LDEVGTSDIADDDAPKHRASQSDDEMADRFLTEEHVYNMVNLKT
jgi:hypothetical protein